MRRPEALSWQIVTEKAVHLCRSAGRCALLVQNVPDGLPALFSYRESGKADGTTTSVICQVSRGTGFWSMMRSRSEMTSFSGGK